MFNPWLAFSFRAARLGLEAQNAMALRVMGLAGVRGHAEPLIVPENVPALEAPPAAPTGATKRAQDRDVPQKVISVPRKRVRKAKRKPASRRTR
jgi:hypothetical protein